jgi:hypothetical protein
VSQITLRDIAVGPAEPVLGQIRLHQPDAILPLSTIHVDKEALGRAGVELLLQQPDENLSQITVPVQMVVRESSCDD